MSAHTSSTLPMSSSFSKSAADIPHSVEGALQVYRNQFSKKRCDTINAEEVSTEVKILKEGEKGVMSVFDAILVLVRYYQQEERPDRPFKQEPFSVHVMRHSFPFTGNEKAKQVLQMLHSYEKHPVFAEALHIIKSAPLVDTEAAKRKGRLQTPAHVFPAPGLTTAEFDALEQLQPSAFKASIFLNEAGFSKLTSVWKLPEKDMSMIPLGRKAALYPGLVYSWKHWKSTPKKYVGKTHEHANMLVRESCVYKHIMHAPFASSYFPEIPPEFEDVVAYKPNGAGSPNEGWIVLEQMHVSMEVVKSRWFRLPWKKAFFVTRRVLQITQILHSMGVVHCALHTRHLMFPMDAGTSSIDRLKLVDFSHARTPGEEMEVCKKQVAFLSPHTLNRWLQGRSVLASYEEDLHAIVYMLIYMIAGRLPWDDKQQRVGSEDVRVFLRQSTREPGNMIYSAMPEPAIDAIASCLHILQSTSPSLAGILDKVMEVTTDEVGATLEHEGPLSNNGVIRREGGEWVRGEQEPRGSTTFLIRRRVDTGKVVC